MNLKHFILFDYYYMFKFQAQSFIYLRKLSNLLW